MRGQFVCVASAAALLASLPAAYAGKAKIYNHCDFPVYSWSVDTENNPQESTVIESNGGSYEEEFRRPASGGVSIKLAPTDDVYTPITQLEYTVNYDLWYDVSNVDCTGVECPFQKHGLYLESGSGCPTVSCTPGNLTCHGAYTLWDDNWASLCCTEAESDVSLYLCRTSADGSDTGSNTGSNTGSYNSSGYTPSPVSYHAPPAYSISSSSTPTSYNPATVVVEVTHYATHLVTVTPSPAPAGQGSPQQGSDTYRARRRRHIHDHMDKHQHRHRH